MDLVSKNGNCFSIHNSTRHIITPFHSFLEGTLSYFDYLKKNKLNQNIVALTSTMSTNIFSSQLSTMSTSNVSETKQNTIKTGLLTILNAASIQSEFAKHIRGKELPQFLL